MQLTIINCKQDNDGNWAPEENVVTVQVPGNEAEAISKQFDEFKRLAIAECLARNKREDAIAAVPEWWQVRAGADRPQLVLQFGEDLGNGKIGPAKYVMTIPYAINSPLNDPPIAQWQKGDFMGIQILPDNSKIIVNCSSFAEADRVLDLALNLVEPSLRYGSTRQLGRRRGQALRSITVMARIATYFSTGQRDTVPDWRVYF